MPEDSIIPTRERTRTMPSESKSGSVNSPGNDEGLFSRYLQGEDAAFIELYSTGILRAFLPMR